MSSAPLSVGAGSTPYDRLAVAQALYKASAAAVSTSKEGNLRDEAQRALEAEFAADGTDRKNLRIASVSVGTLAVEYAKAHAEVSDPGAFAAWAGGLAAAGDPRARRRRVVDASMIDGPTLDIVAKRCPAAVREEFDAGELLGSLAERQETGEVYDPQTGECPVPGVRWAPKSPSRVTCKGFRPADLRRAFEAAGGTLATAACAMLPAPVGEEGGGR